MKKTTIIIALAALALMLFAACTTNVTVPDNTNPDTVVVRDDQPDTVVVDNGDPDVIIVNNTMPDNDNDDVNVNVNVNTTVSAPENPPVKDLVIETYNFGFKMNDVVIRKGDKVRLTMKVTDGTHGISIPAFGVSTGAAGPDQEKTVEFIADTAGSFPFRCNVPCGSGHSSMMGTLEVLA